MKTLEKDELFQNLREFLKGKGIEFVEGSYAHRIQKSCALLTDAINVGQGGYKRAKGQVDKKLDQMRQVIHEKTAPKPAAKPSTTEEAPPQDSSTPSA